MENWTLCVKDFGKIKEAKIEVSPFTLFIGDNNSGKSYLMTLIYGLLNYSDMNLSHVNYASKNYKKCANIFTSLYSDVKNDASGTKKEIALTGEYFVDFIVFFNEMLNDNKEELLKRLFNKQVDIGDIHLEFPYKPNWNITCESMDSNSKNNEATYSFYLANSDTGKSGMRIRVPQPLLEVEDFGVFESITRWLIIDLFEVTCGIKPKKILYLPASRTGFMLTYKSLTNSSLGVAFSLSTNEDKLNTKTTLTKPCVDFLQHINRVSALNEKNDITQSYENIISLLENNIIDGHVSANDLPSADIFYNPSGSKEPLPLYISSGVVTEMAPLLLLLKHNYWNTIMMEEPEMCLHPHLQWQFARVLIQLLNAGTNIISTTHSDTIIQHINNMIKLNSNSGSKSLLKEKGYSSEDILDCRKVKIYQFDVENDHKTKISPLTCSEHGFAVPTFNNTLKAMFDESQKFEHIKEV